MSTHLLQPELIRAIPLTGTFIARELEVLAEAESSRPRINDGASIVIRTLNEEATLEPLLQDIHGQELGFEPQIIVVDNESTDRTREVAKYYGGMVVSIARGDFTYPRSLNRGVEVADNDAVFLTVGHARLSNTQLIQAATRIVGSDCVGGVFGRTLPSSSASKIERGIATGNVLFLKEKQIKKAGLGVLGATSAAISKSIWFDLGKFDERYESGGEDTAMAERMLSTGARIVEHPLLAMHHSHGLGLKNTVQQWSHWARTLKGPIPLNIENLASRRPDIKR